MSLQLPVLPARLPVIHLPSTVRPAPPVVPVDRQGERPVPGNPQPPRPLPGAIIDTWASPEALPGGSFAPSPVTPTRPAAAATPAVPAPTPGKLALDLASPDTLAEPAASLADALRHAVETSGVFYESHLAEWVEGRRSLSDVARETRSPPDAPAVARNAPDTDPLRSQQIDFLRQGELGWTLPAPWQGTSLWVSESPSGQRDATGGSALIRLDLEVPGRGRLQVALRLDHQGLFVDLGSDEGAGILPEELADLGRRLRRDGSTRLAAFKASAAVCASSTGTGSARTDIESAERDASGLDSRGADRTR